MEKITKKAFMAQHKGCRIVTVVRSSASMVNERLQKLVVNELTQKLVVNELIQKSVPVSRPNLENDGEYKKTMVYSSVIQGTTFYFVESTYDNSKNRYCSWNNTETETVIYVKGE